MFVNAAPNKMQQQKRAPIAESLVLQPAWSSTSRSRTPRQFALLMALLPAALDIVTILQ